MSTAALRRPDSGGRDTIPVSLGDRSYDIVVGRGASSELAARLATMGARKAALVTDDIVAALHGERIGAAIAQAGLVPVPITIPAGEPSKSFAQLEAVCDATIAGRLERRDIVVAVGGGVVGDLAGFAAAIVLRGIRSVQIPTTLLAQVDSSVGGKTGINTGRGKNLVGAFHQPNLVIADTALLDTLPLREMRAGYAEVVKYGLIDDPAFFAWCEGNWQGLFAGGPEREYAVAQSCRAKAAVVARDETETGDRALLNLGHTFAHALERAVGFDGRRLVHGEAVAIGLCLALRFSAHLGLAPSEDAARLERHLVSAGLPTSLRDVPGGCGPVADLVAAMAKDKKVTAGQLTFILARGIGRSFVATGIDPAAVSAFLDDQL